MLISQCADIVNYRWTPARVFAWNHFELLSNFISSRIKIYPDFFFARVYFSILFAIKFNSEKRIYDLLAIPIYENVRSDGFNCGG